MKTDLEQKWAEVLDYALQHATGQGSRTGFRWLEGLVRRPVLRAA